MYRLELDLHLYFDPPMNDHGPPIKLTRQIELPFPPSVDVSLFSRHFDECREPPGFLPRDISWDVDRQVFLAHTTMVDCARSIDEIPLAIKTWLDLGWKWGSAMDRYAQTEVEGDDVLIEATAGAGGTLDDPYDEEAALRTTVSKKRPKEYNRVFKAMIRLMAEIYNNESAAYAMQQTGLCFTEHELRGRDDELSRQWRAAIRGYSDKSFAEKDAWRGSLRRHPKLERLVAELR